MTVNSDSPLVKTPPASCVFTWMQSHAHDKPSIVEPAKEKPPSASEPLVQLTRSDDDFWNSAAVLALVDQINKCISRSEKKIRKKDKKESRPYRVGILMPIYAIENLHTSLWQHTRATYDENKSFICHGESVVRVAFSSHYKHTVLPPLTRLAQRQALSVKQHVDRIKENQVLLSQRIDPSQLKRARLGHQKNITGVITKKWLPHVHNISSASGERLYRATVLLDDGLIATGTLPSALTQSESEVGSTIRFSAVFLIDKVGLKFKYPRIEFEKNVI